MEAVSSSMQNSTQSLETVKNDHVDLFFQSCRDKIKADVIPKYLRSAKLLHLTIFPASFWQKKALTTQIKNKMSEQALHNNHNITIINVRLKDHLKIQMKPESKPCRICVYHSFKEKRCPKGWKKFGSSCYYKSTEQKTWTDSRSSCHFVGSDLVVVNSKEEQEFVSTLNQNSESWIGLIAERSFQKQKHEWKWVDGSPLTET
uniref:C-type lectin domain-containing protein n=1 Tax=Oryzias latipes TaxID=8090 RepID=A0A3P9IKW6_ORYLA